MGSSPEKAEGERGGGGVEFEDPGAVAEGEGLD